MIGRFNAVRQGLSNRLNSYPNELERCGSGGQKSAAKNHYFGGFDESSRGLALLKAHLAGSIRGDDGGDVLASDGERYLRQQSFYLEVDDSTHELISAADMPELGTAFRRHVLAGGAIQVAIKFTFRDAMVSAPGLYRAQLFGVNPSLQRGITYAQNFRGIARPNQSGVGFGH
jgi:hypothetical protein